MSEALTSSFSWVIQDKLAGSCQPGNYESALAQDLEWIQSQGIDSVVSLNENTSLLKPEIMQKYGLSHLKCPIADYHGPSIDQCKEICDFIDSHTKTLIHCNAGMGRTGTALACYIIKSLHQPALDTIKELRAKRKGSIQTFKQEDTLKDWEKYLMSQ